MCTTLKTPDKILERAKRIREVWGPLFDCPIAAGNIGEHDADNSFMSAPLEKQLDEWQQDHEGCVPIGICYDKSVGRYDGEYQPMVFEDDKGDRYYTHIDFQSRTDYFDLAKE